MAFKVICVIPYHLIGDKRSFLDFISHFCFLFLLVFNVLCSDFSAFLCLLSVCLFSFSVLLIVFTDFLFFCRNELGGKWYLTINFID